MHATGRHGDIPGIGDRVERSRAGVTQRGTVHYADQLQVLVKWDDGSSSSLRVGRDKFHVIEAMPTSSVRSDVKRSTRA